MNTVRVGREQLVGWLGWAMATPREWTDLAVPTPLSGSFQRLGADGVEEGGHFGPTNWPLEIEVDQTPLEQHVIDVGAER